MEFYSAFLRDMAASFFLFQSRASIEIERTDIQRWVSAKSRLKV